MAATSLEWCKRGILVVKGSHARRTCQVVQVCLYSPLVLQQSSLCICTHVRTICATQAIAVLVESRGPWAWCVPRHLPIIVLSHC